MMKICASRTVRGGRSSVAVALVTNQSLVARGLATVERVTDDRALRDRMVCAGRARVAALARDAWADRFLTRLRTVAP